MTNNNRVFDICKEQLLGYATHTGDGSYDDTLDYISVTVKFYIKGETSNENYTIVRSYLDSIIFDTLVEKMSFLNDIDPYKLSHQLKNEDENE